jgi:hypothetical protein
MDKPKGIEFMRLLASIDAVYTRYEEKKGGFSTDPNRSVV